MTFNGSDYVPSRDDARLSAQYERIFSLMQDQQWRTLQEIADTTHDPPASVSAQLRHMRKARFGAHTVLRQHVSGGLYTYQLIPRAQVVL